MFDFAMPKVPNDIVGRILRIAAGDILSQSVGVVLWLRQI